VTHYYQPEEKKNKMLFQQYKQEIVPKLKKELDTDNPLALPKVEKVVVNMRVSEGKEDRGAVEEPKKQLKKITGQKPKVCRAKQSISDFKLTKGDPIGLQVTLRGKRMYDFLERLFKLVLPRLKDFRGLDKDQFDGHGNYNIGLEEQTVFPEINVDKIDKVRGLQITIVTNTRNDEKAEALLRNSGLPFKKEEE
jgi:large subunit ribosomal protein L5